MNREKFPTIVGPEEEPSQPVYLKEAFKDVKNNFSPCEQEVFNSLVFYHRDLAPKMKEFNYPDVEEDYKKLLEKQKEVFKKISAKEEKVNYIRAKICEALLPNLIENYWIPERFYFTETSEFDDWVNGVDSVMEFERKPEKGAIIDFTTSADKEKIRDKMIKITEKIEAGTLFEIKYFKSQKEPVQYSHLKMVPALIVGIAPFTLRELCDLYSKKEKKKIENHWFKYGLFDQILAQIEYYKKYILEPRRKNYQLEKANLMAQKYEELKKAIEDLKENPLHDLIQKGVRISSFRKKSEKKDKVYKNILDYVI